MGMHGLWFLENVDDIFQQNGRVGNRTGSALIRLRDKLNCRINNSNSPGYATPTIWLISVPSVLAAAEEERVYIHASMPHPHLHPIHPLLPSRHTSFMPEISSSGLQPRKAQFGHHRTTDASSKTEETPVNLFPRRSEPEMEITILTSNPRKSISTLCMTSWTTKGCVAGTVRLERTRDGH